MTTTAQNNQAYAANDVLRYPILADGNGDINQGDLVYSTSNVVKSVSTDANAATFAGVAGDTSYNNLYGTKKYLPQLPVFVKGIFTFKTTSGDTMNHGDAVYIGADAQTITTTDPGAGHKMGYCWMRPGQSAVAGGAGVTIDVLIVALAPVSGGL